MKAKSYLIFGAAFWFLAVLWSHGAFAAQVKDACTDGEKWDFGKAVPEVWQTEMSRDLAGKNSPVRSFSQAMALRRQARAPGELRILSEYWVSRALFDAKLFHIAHSGFSLIAAYPTSERVAGVQLAAVECLNRIGRRYPTLTVPTPVTQRAHDLIAFATQPNQKEVLAEMLLIGLKQDLALSKGHAQIQRSLAALEQAAPAENPNLAFGIGLAASAAGDYAKSTEAFERFLTKPIDRYVDQARLLLARSYFALGQHDKAAPHLRLVRKSSNELATALSELAWHYLMAGKYSEAIGTAMNLQAGGLRHTFAPEAPMVMAMALNELCQYPESLRSIGTFRIQYEKPYRWLDDWRAGTKLYPEAVRFIRKQPTAVPDRIGSEWVRSPVFIANQDEVNLLFDERESSAKLGRSGGREQRELASKIKGLWEKLKPRVKLAHHDLKRGEPLPPSLQNELLSLKQEITNFRRLWNAAPAWRSILSRHEKQAPGIERKLLAEINADLDSRSYRMHEQMQEIAENNQLIEVEIYNGATNDIIWQNAHPDYKELAVKINEQSRKASAEKVWDWGRAPAGSSEDAAEIWEDELGSFKADLFDNCSSKDKYLAIRRKK